MEWPVSWEASPLKPLLSVPGIISTTDHYRRGWPTAHLTRRGGVLAAEAVAATMDRAVLVAPASRCRCHPSIEQLLSALGASICGACNP